MSKRIAGAAALAIALALIVGGLGYRADEFTQKDLDRWNGEFMSVVKTGRELWVSPDLGTNGE